MYPPKQDFTIICLLGARITFKTVYRVRLLVPSLGFPAPPPECADPAAVAAMFAGFKADQFNSSRLHRSIPTAISTSPCMKVVPGRGGER